jgi:hypothetical protein
VSGTGTINGTSIPASKTLVVTTDKLSALASTSSSELAGVISDETGTGALVFANTPTLVTPNIGAATGTSVNLSGAGTFGGDLTVGGTATTSGKLTVSTTAGQEGMLVTGVSGEWTGRFQANTTSGSSYGLLVRGGTNTSDKALSVYNAGGTTELIQVRGDGLTTLTGNLTVSGTGTSSVAGKLAVGTTAVIGNAQFTLKKATNKNLNIDAAAGAVSGISIYAGTDADAYTGLQVDGDKLYLNARSGGNVLIGTTIDGGQKLQVSGTAYVSGDATFAGVISQPTASAGQNNVQTLAANSGFWNNMNNNSNAGRLIYGVEGAAGASFTGSTANAAFAGSNAVNAFHLLANGAIAATVATTAIFVANTTAAPSSNPSGGGYLYVESGALKYRGSSGTVTTIANA